MDTSPPQWGEYLARNPSATLFHDPRWALLMRRTYGNRCYYLTTRRGERITGVLQLVAKKSLLFGSHLCSLPYFDASGILADDETTAGALVAEAESLRSGLRARWVELRQESSLPGGLTVNTDKVTVALPLPESADVLWDRLTPKVRNQVRKAEKEGLTARKGGAELLGEFHAVYVRNMRDLGSPPHGLRFFRNMAETFGEHLSVFVVTHEGKTVAASLTLSDRHALRVPWAGSDWRVRRLCGNMLLYWKMLSAACEQGSPAFDFGRGTRGSGTHRFKLQWGGREQPLHWHYLLPEGAGMPGLRHDNPKYRFIEACWRKLPLWAVRAMGPRIIAKLS